MFRRLTEVVSALYCLMSCAVGCCCTLCRNVDETGGRGSSIEANHSYCALYVCLSSAIGRVNAKHLQNGQSWDVKVLLLAVL